MKMIKIFIQVRRIDKRLLVSEEFISWYCLKAAYDPRHTYYIYKD